METTTPQPLNLLERFNRWIQESIMVKLFSIGFLILILLIPSAWINDLIYERESRAEEVMAEVADKWSGSQTMSGPILVIPYKKQEVIDRGKDGKEIHEYIQKAYFLPEGLDIKGSVVPEELKRGIFDAVVYKSQLDITSTFNAPNFKELSIPEENVIWKDAQLVMGISDLRGISENPTFRVGDKAFGAEPANNIGVSVKKPPVELSSSEYVAPEDRNAISTTGIAVKLNWADASSFTGNVKINLNLKGSRRLDFVPAGKTTNVKLNGSWGNPSFDGEFLPVDRNVTDTNFDATWKVLHFNRPFSQQWTEANQQLSGADFGVKLLIPVDQYQKSNRTSKYSVLIILLTFMSLFLVEITQKIRIHPFQYILIGAALTIYYTLLLSFSEHVGYNIAYGIASLATVILISLYSMTFFKSARLTLLFSVVLSIFYTFIFVIIQQQDFSLLLGSIGLFLIISLLMYFSRKVSWYREEEIGVRS